MTGAQAHCASCRRSEELASLALTATSAREYRTEALRRLVSWVDGDGGLIHRHWPTTAAFDTGIYDRMDLHYATRCVAGWDVQYGRDMAPVVRDSLERGGTTLDARSLSARSRLAFYSDIIIPSGVREGIFCTVELGGEPLALCVMNRSGRERFSAASLELIRSLLPLFSLGDRVLARRAPPSNDEVMVARLSPREREVAELLALGYTNGEIALALTSSIHTVRNQVASLFRKAGASTRAELVGLLRPRPT
ncbi:MAG TPA: helix-turn-helix transcriptional regulator [Kofleriaceae bacterium]|nr:helix-turn-helix transcriptional regulator [Kofleriaceae bacterium]